MSQVRLRENGVFQVNRKGTVCRGKSPVQRLASMKQDDTLMESHGAQHVQEVGEQQLMRSDKLKLECCEPRRPCSGSLGLEGAAFLLLTPQPASGLRINLGVSILHIPACCALPSGGHVAPNMLFKHFWWLKQKRICLQCWRAGSIPGSGRSPGEGNGNPLQYSYLGNSMDRGTWWASIHGVAKSQT